MSDAEKVRENRLRRMAARQGLTLTKSRRRDPRATDYGAYWIDAPNVLVRLRSLDEVERYLVKGPEDKFEYRGFRVLGPHHHPVDPDPAVSGWWFGDDDQRPILEWVRDPVFSTHIGGGRRTPPEGWRLYLVEDDWNVGGTADDLDWAIEQAESYIASKSPLRVADAPACDEQAELRSAT